METQTINHLLNFDDFHGDKSERLWPVIKFLLVLCIPFLIHVYYLQAFVEWKWFWIFMVPYTIRMAMIFPGREKDRLKYYEKRIRQEYDAIADISDIKNIEEDGCIQYTTGRCSYMIVFDNTNNMDPGLYAKNYAKIIELLKDFAPTLRMYNTAKVQSLLRRYANVHTELQSEVAGNILDIIDYNRKLVSISSTVVTNVIQVYIRGDKEHLERVIKNIISSDIAKRFKDIHIATPAEVLEFTGEDIKAAVDLDLLILSKNTRQQYFQSKIIGYDLNEEEEYEAPIGDPQGFYVNYE